ncbi:anti-sigma B factor RsbW [Cohnella thailandensis]|uniref:Anti-sigma B factor RsbW n=1 Tax=Cohnella thailandensis TaxID=557557 RepID=A0A841T0B6_9BACL|nr:anti-sigma B factor RsbW [Cohnella thailandensis]MBB6637873.1 anti-sigma B factor RsbW [Cohnella thailandensis]MBP1977419.1 serine/threonine-protein kinase RsbW [Cohnella thailandensis]
MVTDNNVKLTVPAQPEFVDLVRLTLFGLATKLKFSYEEIEDMKVAVSEACNNAVLHAYQGTGGHIDIEFGWIGEEELQITIRDHGESFQAPEASRTSNLHGKSIEEIQSGGLGLYLMQALMDRVELNTENGTAVTLTKRRTAPETV